MSRHAITNAAAALEFIFAGNARFTLVSKKTGRRFTYRARQKSPRPGVVSPIWFFGLLTGSDNESSFTHLATSFAKASPTAQRGRPVTSPVLALQYAIKHLKHGRIPADLEIWHEGKCGRCARTLTVPESIASGFGPECVKRRMAA